VTGAVCRVEIAAEQPGTVHPLATKIMLALVHRFPAWLIAQRIPLTELELPFPEPAHSADYVPIFGVAPVFDASVAAIGFDARRLGAPVVRDERELLDYIHRSPADLLRHRDYGTTTADRVRSVIERGDLGTWVRSEDVAAQLSISAQHMRRLLRWEGTSFKQIREEILRQIAVDSLRRGDETVEEISGRLGFFEPSAFRRAFTRWVGISPGRYRASAGR
jgi:AraC-like DNA-binding protein